jgi:hypothetical protein
LRCEIDLANEALEQWEMKLGNCEVTPQAIRPIAKSLIKRNEPKAQTAVHCNLGLKFHPLEYAKATADCLENQFTPHALCDDNHEWRVGARVKALFKAVYNNPPPPRKNKTV